MSWSSNRNLKIYLNKVLLLELWCSFFVGVSNVPSSALATNPISFKAVVHLLIRKDQTRSSFMKILSPEETENPSLARISWWAWQPVRRSQSALNTTKTAALWKSLMWRLTKLWLTEASKMLRQLSYANAQSDMKVQTQIKSDFEWKFNSGTSCEKCADGYYRGKGLYLGQCIPCECNGMAKTCNKHTGACIVSLSIFLIPWKCYFRVAKDQLQDQNAINVDTGIRKYEVVIASEFQLSLARLMMWRRFARSKCLILFSLLMVQVNGLRWKWHATSTRQKLIESVIRNLLLVEKQWQKLNINTENQIYGFYKNQF